MTWISRSVDEIFNAILKTRPDVNNEIQLTSAIQHLIEDGFAVYALKVGKKEKRIDIGTAECMHAKY